LPPMSQGFRMSEHDLRRVAPTVCGVLGLRPPGQAETRPLEEVVGTMGNQGRLAVVVIDAFGASTWSATRAETPTFNALASRHLLRLKSVMPTITPVNFATMLTGASPESHGIRDRTEELKLETVFDVMREKGRSSATAARALSSLGILISPFADRPGIAESNLDDEVCSIAVNRLREGVNLLWVQLLDVDDAGHMYGPLSPQGVKAAGRDDGHLRRIAVEACRRGYGLMVLADHGQHTIVRDDSSQGGWHGTEAEEDVYVPFVWCKKEDIKGTVGLID
jgi:predicted AlkP superfamily pyrophosphatase or phosphodiesterase